MKKLNSLWTSIIAKKFLPGLVANLLLLAVGALIVVTLNPKPSLASARPFVVPGTTINIGGDFTLNSINGPVALHDFRGDVVLLYFGYTHCPDACPTTLTRWRVAFKALSPHKLAHVRGIFVSVDPNRDTPELLNRYVNHFHPNIIGVTGSLSELRKVTTEYRAKFGYEKMKNTTGDDYGVNHSGAVYVIDPTGKVRDLLTFQSSSEEILASIRAVFHEEN